MSLTRPVAIVGIATAFSRLLGFARDMALAALLGAGARADAFLVALQFFNLIRRLLAEGALNAALVPAYLRAQRDGGASGARSFAGRLIGTTTVALFALALLLALAMPLVMLALAPGLSSDAARMNEAVTLARLMLPYLVFAGPVAILMGVLNASHRYAAAALVAAAFNATLLLAAAYVIARGYSDGDAGMPLAIAVALAGLAQLVLVGGGLLAARIPVTPLRVSFDDPMRQFWQRAAPGLIAGSLPQFAIVAGIMAVSAEPSAISWLYYANRLIELPLGIVGVALGTVLVPALTRAVQARDAAASRAAQSRGLELALGLSLPAAAGLALLALPIVQVLFERGAFDAADSNATARALAALAFGLPGHVLVKTLSASFFARDDTVTPMRTALLGFGAAIVASFALMPLFGHAGVALAVALSGWVSACILAWQIRARFGLALDAATRGRIVRIVIATLAMTLAVHGAQIASAGLHRALALGLAIAAGLAVYAALLALLGVFRTQAPKAA